MEKVNNDRPIPFRVVKFEPCRVAAARGFGGEPEGIAWKSLLSWMGRRGLSISDARFLGFNNPNPSPASANYGYEQWVALKGEAGRAAESATGKDEGIEFKDFEGGLYAVAEHRGSPMGLPASWGALSLAVERSGFRRSTRQWLEEVLTPELLAAGGEPDWDKFAFDICIAVEEV